MNINTKEAIKSLIPKRCWVYLRKTYLARKRKKAAIRMIAYYSENKPFDAEQERILENIKKDKQVKVFYFKPKKRWTEDNISIGFDKVNGMFYANLYDGQLYLRSLLKSQN